MIVSIRSGGSIRNGMTIPGRGGTRVNNHVFKINKRAKERDWNGSFSVRDVRYVCVVVLVVGDEMFICGQGTGIYAATRD